MHPTIFLNYPHSIEKSQVNNAYALILLKALFYAFILHFTATKLRTYLHQTLLLFYNKSVVYV